MKNSLKIEIEKVEDIKFTKENARKITEESLNDLKLSINTLGIIRPLIITDKKELMSGNQRTKIMRSLNIRTAPVVIIKCVAKNDYINFTLLVNSIEHNKSKVIIKNPETIPNNDFIAISNNRIKTLEFKNPVVRRDIARSVIRYGQWGNIIINKKGEVIFNSDYASTMETIGYPVTVYKVTDEQERFINDYFFRQYGVYSYDHLNYPSYPQTYAQPSRRTDKVNKQGNGMRSILYDEIASRTIDNGGDLRYLDFGAGKKEYARHYQSLGYSFDAYEPFYKVVLGVKEGNTYFDMKEIIKSIKDIEDNVRNNGLYDCVICDSVLNATMSKKLEMYVIATCASMLKDDGVAYFSSRNLKRLLQVASTNDNSKQALDDTKRTFELDENGMYLSYRKGHYTGQKYHDVGKLIETLEIYFENVQQIKGKDKCSTGIFFECKNPKKIDEEYLSEVLNEEFNMLYPNDYRHNQHEDLVRLVIEENRKRQD